MAQCCRYGLSSVEQWHDGPATAPASPLGYALARGTSRCLGLGPILREADRRPRRATRQEFHQFLQATLLRPPLGQATASGPRLGQEAGRAAPPSSQGPPTRTPRATPPGLRL